MILIDIKTGQEVQPVYPLRLSVFCEVNYFDITDIVIAHLKDGDYKETLKGSYNKETHGIEYTTDGLSDFVIMARITAVPSTPTIPVPTNQNTVNTTATKDNIGTGLNGSNGTMVVIVSMVLLTIAGGSIYSYSRKKN
ncbi:hypothetical protein [Eubacterium aggregans]|uniref:hypothetical protein n=1 Tax=Eubacterium aggregans TaxID=81409 RepID=UPI003F340232